MSLPDQHGGEDTASMFLKWKDNIGISYLGYTTLERQIKGATLNVEMQDEVNELDEVVVVGYGDMKKRDLTGAISSVTAESIKEQNSVSVLDAMQGQIAGLSIVTVQAPRRRSRSTRTRNSNLRGRRCIPYMW